MNVKEKGITLVALVITIIILLLLAGITIAGLSNSGLLNKSNQSSEKSRKAEAEEKMKILLYEWNIENIQNGKKLINFLNEKVDERRIESVEETDEGIEVYINGFVVVLDENGNVIEEMQIPRTRTKDK